MTATVRRLHRRPDTPSRGRSVKKLSRDWLGIELDAEVLRHCCRAAPRYFNRTSALCHPITVRLFHNSRFTSSARSSPANWTMKPWVFVIHA
jgi:hypothetical protein